MEIYNAYITLLTMKNNWRILNEEALELQKKRFVPGLSYQSMGASTLSDLVFAFAINPDTKKWAFVLKFEGKEFWAPAGTGQYIFNNGVIDKIITAWWKEYGPKFYQSVQELLDKIWRSPEIDNHFNWEFSIPERIRGLERTFTHTLDGISISFIGKEDMRGRYTGRLLASYDTRNYSRVLRKVMIVGPEIVTMDLEYLCFKEFPATVKVLLRDAILKWVNITKLQVNNT